MDSFEKWWNSNLDLNLDGIGSYQYKFAKVAYKAGMLRAAEIGENGDFSTSYHYSPMDVVRAIKEEAESIK